MLAGSLSRKDEAGPVEAGHSTWQGAAAQQRRCKCR